MRRAFTLVEFLVVLAIIGILAAILFPIFGRTRCNYRLSGCQSNLKQIGLGFIMYTQDYDGIFPAAKSNSKTTWATSLQSYLKNWQVFDCPSAALPPVQKVYFKPVVGKTTDYFYNRRFEKLNQTKLVAAKSTILGGDGADNAFLGSTISQLPISWRESSTAPTRRHPYSQNPVDRWLNGNLGRANYLFADGHVKAMTPEKITLDKPTQSGIFTFLPR